MIFVAEITAAVDGSGTEETFYFSSGRGWATTAADTPASTYISNGLLPGGGYKREMFSGDGLFGAMRSAFGVLRINNADGALDAWKDYGFDDRIIKVYMGAEEGLAYPSGYTLVFEARMLRAVISLRAVELILRDGLSALDKPICQTALLGTGDLEGPATLAGRLMPRQYGYSFIAPGVLVEPSKKIWLLCENPCASTGQAAYNAGVAVTLGSHYASTATLLSTAPAAGQARMYIGGPTYIRYETAPTSVQVSLGEGYTIDGSAATFGQMAQEAGIAGATGGVTSHDIYVDDDRTTYLQAMAREARARPSWFGFDRNMNFKAELIADPSGESPVATITHWEILSVERSTPGGFDVPAWKVTTRGRKNWAGVSNLSAAADDDLRQTYYKAETAEDSSILLKHPLAGTLAVDTGGFWIGGAADFLALHKLDRDMLTVVAQMDATNVTYDINDTVTFKHPRFGFGSGKKFLIVGIALDFASARITWSLWG